MNITVLGTGYVGLVTGTIFSELGNNVTCIDIDEKKIEGLKGGVMPIYEPGLKEVVDKNAEAGRLDFKTDLTTPVKHADVIFIAVGTPQDTDGSADLQYVKAVAEDIGKALDKIPANDRSFKLIVNKSTVPVGTGDIVKNIIAEHYDGDFEVVSNPEFLREGQAVGDCLNPDRVVVGIDSDSSEARERMELLHKPLNCPIVFTDIKSAELIKYSSNSYLAASISFINSVARICEAVGADVEMVSKGMKLDKRIGKHAFLSAGLGYGGSCFPKDVKALIKIADEAGPGFSILRDVEEINDIQKHSAVNKLQEMIGDLNGKTIALWGLAFKPKTDDLRDAVSLVLIEDLKKLGVDIKVYDPVAMDHMKAMHEDLYYADSAFDAAKDADALVVVTEWDEFKQVDVDDLASVLKAKVVVDGRNIFDPSYMREKGFTYMSVGRP